MDLVSGTERGLRARSYLRGLVEEAQVNCYAAHLPLFVSAGADAPIVDTSVLGHLCATSNVVILCSRTACIPAT